MGKPDYKSIDIIKALERSIKAIEDMFPEKEIKITINNEVDNPTIQGTTIIDNCIINLLQNAILADKNSEKMIDINVQLVSTNILRIDIIDNGEGIPDEIKPKVFQRLFRIRTKKRGSGLGLYIVKTIVEKFDGKVTVENRVKNDYTKGTKFTMLFPKSETDD